MNTKHCMLLLGSLLLWTPVFAQRNGGPPPKYELGVGVAMLIKETLVTPGHEDQKTISSYNETPKKSLTAIPTPYAKFNFSLNKEQLIYIGLAHGLAVGWQLETESSALKAKLNLRPGSVFKNPYLLNTGREKTSSSELDFDISYKQTSGLFGLEGVLRHSQLSIASDTTPETHTDLGRAGQSNAFSLVGWVAFVSLAAEQEQFSAKGTADSFKAIRYTLASVIPNPWFFVRIAYQTGNADYQTSHPIFNKTRDDAASQLFVMLSYKINQNQSVALNLFQQNTNSNIQFFDEKGQLAALSWQWQAF